MATWSRRCIIPCAAVLIIVQQGSRATLAQTSPATVGEWSAVTTWPNLAAHAHLLPNGTVLFWPTFANGNKPTIYSPITGKFTLATPAAYNIFCSGHSYTADGKLLVTGGHIVSNFGFAHATLFDPATSSWSPVPDMWAGRWYPTNTTLPNGDIITMSGTMDPADGLNPMPEVWRHDTNSWQQLFAAQLVLPYYPRMFVAPNGKLFLAGSGPTTRYLDTTGSGTWSLVGNTNFNNSRDYGAAVMYDVGKVLLVGGGDPPTATSEIIDLNAATPTWTYTTPMSQPRRQGTATTLPDGNILVTGGSSTGDFDTSTSPVLTPELWNPTTGTWTKMASSTIYRGYHSTALLLPDGRVLSAGGNDNSLYKNGEIFSPPYLFNGARPAITSAPSSLPYGKIVNVVTPDAANILQVTMISLGSVTHAFNMNNTFNRLSFSVTSKGDGLNVLTPASGNVAAPGPYLLFILNASGVPSVAANVTVGAATSAPGPVSVVPSSIALRTVVNKSKAVPASVTNTQLTAVNFSSFAVTAPFSQTNNCTANGQSGTLAAGATCTVMITYAPTVVGTNTSTLTVTDDAGNSPQTVALQGLSILPVTFNPSSQTFSKTTVGSLSSSRTFILKNEQDVPLPISSIAVTGDFALDFNTDTACMTSGTYQTVAAGNICKFNVTFKPTITGTRTGSVTIIDNAPNSPQSVPLKGTGS
jgi:hypothetical protein